MRLSYWEKRWLKATFEGFAPPVETPRKGEVAPRPGEVDYVGAFVRVNAHAGPIAKLGLRAAVVLAGTAPVWHRRQLTGIDRLPVESRTELLRELAAHPVGLVRELVWLLKVQTGLTIFGSPGARERSNYYRGARETAPVRIRPSRVLREVA